MILFLDVETTDVLPKRFDIADPKNPHVVQLGSILYDVTLEKELVVQNMVIKPDGWVVPQEAANIHGYTTERCEAEGVPIEAALSVLRGLIHAADKTVIFNAGYDAKVLNCEYWRRNQANPEYPDIRLPESKLFCAMLAMAPVMKLPGRYGDFGWPKLSAAFEFCYPGQKFAGAHDAMADIRATRDVVAMARFQKWFDL